jgi:hypothetical protein
MVGIVTQLQNVVRSGRVYILRAMYFDISQRNRKAKC